MTYLKTKKMTANFYQPADKGIHLIAKGGTAYHTEYNSLYSLMKHLTDEQVCKLQQIDTVPEVSVVIFGPFHRLTNIFYGSNRTVFLGH